MKKVLCTLMLFLIFSFIAWSQNFDKKIVIKDFDCRDVSISCSELYQKYIEEGKYDSASMLVSYWQGKCDLTEPVLRAKLLLALLTGVYPDTQIPPDFYSYILNFKQRMDMIQDMKLFLYNYNRYYLGFVPVGGDFDRFTIQTAYKLKSKFEPGTTRSLLCNLYSGNADTVISNIKSGVYDQSIVGVEYKEQLRKLLKKTEVNLALMTGLWIPTGGLTVLGVHPEFGFQGGIKFKKFNFDVTLLLSFLNSAHDYYARRPGLSDSLILTNHYLGGYIGLDFGYDIFQKRRHEVQLLAGAGGSGFDALNENKDKGYKAESVWSYDFNIGTGYRYYFRPYTYVGVKVKLHFADYTSGHIVDFTGYPLTIEFSFGGLLNDSKKTGLKKLGYKLRE